MLEQQAADKATPVEKLREFAQQSVELARIVARNACADPELLRELTTSPDQEVRCGVASNPNVPVEVLFKLGEEFPEQLLENPLWSLLLLENPNLFKTLPPATIQSLVKVEHVPTSLLDWAVNHRYLAFPAWLDHYQRRGTPNRTLVELATRTISQRSYEWRKFIEAVIRNPNTPDDVLEMIATREHRDKEVTTPQDELDPILAVRPGLPERVMEILAVRGKESAKIKIAERLDTPVTLLRQLAENRSLSTAIALALASNPNTPEDILERLISQDRDPYRIRQSAARNPNLSERMVFLLLEQDHLRPHIRNLLKRNLHLSSTVLEKLANSSSSAHRWLAASHPNTPMPILMNWLKSEDRSLVACLAENPAMPQKIILGFATFGSLETRGAVTRNPSTPEWILLRLSKDPHPYVHDSARQALRDAENSKKNRPDQTRLSPDQFWQ